MGVHATFMVIYGFKIPSSARDKNGNEFNGNSEEMEPYLCGTKEADGFTMIYDQMGSDQSAMFGQLLSYMNANSGVVEIDLDGLRTDRAKELYRKLFKDYDVPMDVEPKLFSVVHLD